MRGGGYYVYTIPGNLVTSGKGMVSRSRFNYIISGGGVVSKVGFMFFNTCLDVSFSLSVVFSRAFRAGYFIDNISSEFSRWSRFSFSEDVA